MRLVMDTGVLGELCHPRYARSRIRLFAEKIRRTEDIVIFLPEIADYELRRELLRYAMKNNQGTSRSLQRIDKLSELFDYLHLDTPTLREGARLWAKVRNAGRPTSDPHALDGDAILAAQALKVRGIVVTYNTAHFSFLKVPTKDWGELSDEWAEELSFSGSL